MEPTKLENQFKEKLDNREINPSEAAWDRLDAMLLQAEKPKPKFKWLYIAASFIGFLLISTILLNQEAKTVENQKNRVVIQQAIKPENSSDQLKPNIEKNDTQTVTVVQTRTAKIQKIQPLEKDSLTLKNKENKVVEHSIINQKTEQEIISSPTKVATVDELLARVNQSARVKNNPNLAVHVNPNQLLQQAENDLEPSFRQSVFGKIAKNFQAVKEAVVNRNNEQ
jgi:hypothetical protein